ncbi:hypothetical protein EG329_000672 [Mollisiaceae sp. DMI_Dod_QoI]|nr:hypothetical protein EG329_000672 [Helotiales sp. DMI_Dod_QoI]
MARKRSTKSIRSICATIGYDSDIKDSRYYTKLSIPVNDFCKKYVEKLPNPVDFSSPHSPDTICCAAAFREENQHLFEDTITVQEILDSLAKLINLQHCNQKRNKTQIVAQKAQTRNSSPFSDHPSTQRNSVNDQSEGENTIDGSVGPHVLEADPYTSQAAAGFYEDHPEADIDGIELEHEITNHLNYVYPLDEAEEVMSSNWLLGLESKCPVAVEALAFRYLHEHNLYDPSTKNRAAINKFVDHMEQTLNAGKDPVDSTKLFNRCKELIKRAVRKWGNGWQGLGFLSPAEDDRTHRYVLKKIPVFESAWKTHRALWVSKTNDNFTEKVINEAPETSTNSRISGLKRKAQLGDSIKDVKMSDGSPIKPPKRKRRRLVASTTPSSNARRRENSMSPLSGDSAQLAPVAAMYTLRNSAPASARQRRSMPDSFGPINGQASRTPNPLSRTIPTNPHQRSPVEALGHDKVHPEPISSNLENNTANNVSIPSTSPAPNNQTITPTANPPAIAQVGNRPLWFALPGPKGDPETSPSKLVAGSQFEVYTRLDLFKLIASRSGQPLEDLAFITFRCAWGGRTPVVVSRFTTEQHWADIKEYEILERYRMEREMRPDRRIFQVWVWCGNNSNLGNEDR